MMEGRVHSPIFHNQLDGRKPTAGENIFRPPTLLYVTFRALSGEDMAHGPWALYSTINFVFLLFGTMGCSLIDGDRIPLDDPHMCISSNKYQVWDHLS